MSIVFYGLLHLSENESNGMNFNAKNFENHKDVYLQNAVKLSMSLKSKNLPFILLTNRAEKLRSDLERLGMSGYLKIENMTFHKSIPSGVQYYSAHFKLDVFSYFSSLPENSYVALLDLDMIALSGIPRCFMNIVNERIPLFYDISDQVIPAFGHDVVIQDIEYLLEDVSEGRSIGGEFISGTPKFFQQLSFEVNRIFDKYIENLDRFHHQGDEMLTSVALEKLRRQGVYIANAGTLGLVGRFWSLPTRHAQRSFDYFKNCFLLHLPSDKSFLSEISVIEAQQQDLFLKRYEAYLKVRELQHSPSYSNRVRRKFHHYVHVVKKAFS